MGRWEQHWELLPGDDDPLFPKTNVGQSEEKKFAPCGLTPEHWSTASSIRDIFQKAFEAAGLPYFNPHSFRSTLANPGEKMCQTTEEIKPWSQNLGHEGVLTTFNSYGEVQPQRQGEIIRGFNSPRDKVDIDDDQILEVLFRRFNKRQFN